MTARSAIARRRMAQYASLQFRTLAANLSAPGAASPAAAQDATRATLCDAFILPVAAALIRAEVAHLNALLVAGCFTAHAPPDILLVLLYFAAIIARARQECALSFNLFPRAVCSLHLLLERGRLGLERRQLLRRQLRKMSLGNNAMSAQARADGGSRFSVCACGMSSRVQRAESHLYRCTRAGHAE